MSVDMSEFYQVFFEEAGELLANMEQLLLGMDFNSPDPENLNAVFRAAHSIKGGAATFGFTDVVEVTHVLESLLDQIRKGEKRLRSDMVDVFLTAGDVLKGQLAGHRGDGQADPAIAAAVCARLTEFVAAADASQSAASAPAPTIAAQAPVAGAPAPVAPVPAAPATQSPAQGASSRGFRVEFMIDGLPADTTTLIGHVIDGLERLGKLSFSRGGRAGGEVVSEDGKPRQIFDSSLTTSATEEDVWEVLAFNLNPASISISGASAGDGPAPSASAGVAEETAEYGFFQKLYEAVVPPGPDAQAAPIPALAPATPAPVAAAPNPSPASPSRSPGRRESDDPNVSVARAGRRDHDKVAGSASTGGDANAAGAGSDAD